MGNYDKKPIWVPYEPAKDCSLGLCSLYCPQWCYIVFPPAPPPLQFSGEASAARTFSPIVIAVVAALSSAFLLLSYYTMATKFCGTFDSHRRRHELGDGIEAHLHEAGWQFSRSSELDQTSINGVSVIFEYMNDDVAIEAADCAVCLTEFREGESLRLLPKCGHAFHVQCIDAWLRSRSNCPLCRVSIVCIVTNPSLPAPAPPEQESETIMGTLADDGNATDGNRDDEPQSIRAGA